MRFGIHLPLIDLGDGLVDLAQSRESVSTAAALGHVTLSANDHLVWQGSLAGWPDHAGDPNSTTDADVATGRPCAGRRLLYLR